MYFRKIKGINNEEATVWIKEDSHKFLKSNNYNYLFKYRDGNFFRWGINQDDDPDYSPFGPEIFDMEISTICHGIGSPCKHCYKSNTPIGKNMSFETFKKIFHKLPITLTQIAFGIGDIDSNPDMFKIFNYCVNNNYNMVIPNVTINGVGLTKEIACDFSKILGAIAVSRYNNGDICYDAVQLLTDKKMKQVNIHMLISKETYEDCFKVIKDSKNDSRLKDLNAIVFLLLKPKGSRNNYNSVSFEEYRKLVEFAFENGTKIGFDSCGAPFFMKTIHNFENDVYKKYLNFAECCESNLFSSYCNCEGMYYPCSFSENIKEWKGINLLNINNFLEEVWNNEITKYFRNKLVNQKHSIKTCRTCPVYPQIYHNEIF